MTRGFSRKTVTDREAEYQTQVSDGDSEVISSFGILMTGAQESETWFDRGNAMEIDECEC